MLSHTLEVLWLTDIILRLDREEEEKDEGEGRDFFKEFDAFLI